jgi:hypothetical protein
MGQKILHSLQRLNNPRERLNTKDMRYLITTGCGHPPFFTSWYVYENCFAIELGMVVYDLRKSLYTKDGKTWMNIESDQL